MIDSKTGNISINNILTLKPNFRFQEIKDLKLGEIQETREMGTEWKWIDIKNLKIENEYYLFFLGFKNKKLKLISFNVNTKPFELDSSWNSWTEKQELKKYKADTEKRWATILSNNKKLYELEKNNLVAKTEEALKHITNRANVLDQQLKDSITNYEKRLEQQRQSYERVSIEMAKSASGQGTVQQTFANGNGK